MEATKSHILPSASWRTMKAGGIIQSESEAWESLADGLSLSVSLKAKEPGAPVSKSKRWKSENKLIWPSSSCFFCLSPQRIGWCPPTGMREMCFTQSTDSDDNPVQKHPYRHTQNNVLPAIWASLSYLGSCNLTHRIHHHRRLSILVLVLSMPTIPSKENVPVAANGIISFFFMAE